MNHQSAYENPMENYLIDNLDRGILEALMGNARTAYAETGETIWRQSGDDSRSSRENEAGGDHYRGAY